MESKRSDAASNQNEKNASSQRIKKKPVKKVTRTVQKEKSNDQVAPEKATKKVGLQLNWNRAIHIDMPIDDTLLRTLTATILKLKQRRALILSQSGIDCAGGEILAMQALLGLLQAPDQDGNRTEIYTVSTNRAYSAAASLLAFGDYSVAFPHSKILYHDVRYSGIVDVTPAKALRTARELERGNVAFS